MSHVLVVGAGFAGLAAALDLGVRGHRVTLLEAAAQAGGEARQIQEAGMRVDLGPTMLADLGPLRTLCDRSSVDLEALASPIRLDPAFLATFPGGVRLAWHRDPGRLASELRRLGPDAPNDWERVMALGAGAARLTARFLAHGDVAGPTDLWRFLASGRQVGADVVRFARQPSLAALLAAHVRTPELRRLLAHFARLIGLEASRAPSLTVMIPYALATSGVWHPRGGLGGLAGALEALAAARGVTVRRGTPVTGLRATGAPIAAPTADGGRVEADGCVAAVDVATTARWLERPGPARRVTRLRPAKTARVAWWVFEGSLVTPVHHTFHFDDGDEPLYVAAPSVSDESLGISGRSILYALMHGHAGGPTDTRFAESVRRRLVALGQWPGGRVLARGVAGSGRSCYGYVIGPGLLRSFRPSQRVRGLPALALAGGSVFPGPGVANAIRSGLRAAALLDAHLGRR